MRVAVLASTISLLLAACADSSGGRGGDGGTAESGVEVTGSTVGGSISSTATAGAGGAGGAGGTSSISLDLRLALDPKAFMGLFGVAPPITNPTEAQLDTLEANADDLGVANEQVAQCEKDPASCRIGTQ